MPRDPIRPDPRTPTEVLEQRIDELEAQLKEARRPGAQTFNIIDIDHYNDPIQGEYALDWPLNGVYYFHEGVWYPIGQLAAKYEIKVFDDEELMITGDGLFKWGIDSDLSGLYLLSASAFVSTTGSGVATIQVQNVTQGLNLLTTAITIDSGEYDSLDAGTQPVINTALTINAKDRLWINASAVPTGAKGLGVRLLFGRRRPTT